MKIIGISGTSGAGKTTLAKALRDSINANHIEFDMFIKLNQSPRHVIFNGKSYRLFHRPAQYDELKVLEVLKALKSGREITVDILTEKKYVNQKLTHSVTYQPTEYVIVEGFLAFIYPELLSLYDKKFFLEIPYEESVNRRDQRKGKKQDLDYLLFTKAEQEKYFLPQKFLKDLIVIDGQDATAKLVEIIKQHLEI